jgi:HEAT repeat protein
MGAASVTTPAAAPCETSLDQAEVHVNHDGQGGQPTALPLLRQLSIGLGVYRLYPGDPSWPLFVSSAERVRDSATVALAEGSFDVEIRGRTMRTTNGALPDDELLGRLALACYERGAERLVVREPPDATDLSLLFRVLSLPVEEVERLGGAPALLRGAGVSSIALGELGPSAPDGFDGRVEAFPREQLDLWDRLRDSVALAAQLFAGGGDAVGDPAAVLRQMEALAAILPPEVREEASLYDRLQEVIFQLPDDPRRKLLAHFIEHHAHDRLAGRLVGIMSDAQLARALVDLAREGHDPLKLAQALADGPGGRTDLSDLTAALMQGHEEAGTIMAGIEVVGALDERVWERSASVLETVSDLLARDLKATESEDARSLHEEFARFERSSFLRGSMLADYLVLESNPYRLRESLAIWTQETRQALHRRDRAALDDRLRALESARARTEDSQRLGALEAAARRVIDASLARELSDPGANEEETKGLLVRLGPAAVDGLFDLLEVEPDRAVRTKLLALLRALPPAHQARLASRLGDDRWYVVRNAVNVLSRSSGAEALTLMTKASRHPTAAVRREAIQGLVAVGGEEAVPAIQALAHGDAEESVRAAAVVALGGLLSPDAVEALVGVVRHGSTIRLKRLALEQIDGHPAPEAEAVLRRLTSRRARPRLRRALRAQARAALRRRAGSP